MSQGPEKKLQNKCIKYLKELKRSGGKVWWTKLNQVFKSGDPDLLICLKGLFLAAELKSPTGTVTTLQAKTLKEIGEAGGRHEVIRTEDAFIAFVGKALVEITD